MSRPLTHAAVIKRCAAKPGAYPDAPWGGEDTVYKVAGKVFAFVGDPERLGGSFKCDRDRIDEWRSRYPEHIGQAPYLGSKPWNRVIYAGVDGQDMAELIDDSYEQVVLTLPKSRRPEGWDA